MKLSIFTVATPEVTPEKLIDIVQKSGIQGIEWRYKETDPEHAKEAPSYWRNNFCTISPNVKEQQLLELAETVQQYGLTNVAVTPYLTVGDLASTEQAMYHAKLIGADMIRVGVPRYDRTETYNEAFARASQYLQQVEKLSEKYGVKGLIETHHETISPSASLAYRLVCQYDPKYIGVLFDPGNMIHEGYENLKMGMELLGDYLAHVHVKNAAWFTRDNRETYPWECKWVGLERGIVDWKQVLLDLKAVGYKGWFGLEDFSGTLSTEELLPFYRKWFQDLEKQIQEDEQ